MTELWVEWSRVRLLDNGSRFGFFRIVLIARIETIGADKYDEEASIDLKYNKNDKRHKRSDAIENITTTEVTPLENITEECVGQKEFCNLSREEYITMLNDYIYPHTYEWVLIGTHTLVFITGLVGNALVCVAVYRNHSMRTVTNYFIVNLAVADFMVILFCLPATVLWDVTETWFLGDVLCKMLLYFQIHLPDII
ncbi:hypothetical protein SFRURICE_017980 [Spodoptera frugiperda]|nr:hypothetical protein SFRURICE_017980 [Spodoptera frugiperda]